MRRLSKMVWVGTVNRRLWTGQVMEIRGPFNEVQGFRRLYGVVGPRGRFYGVVRFDR